MGIIFLYFVKLFFVVEEYLTKIWYQLCKQLFSRTSYFSDRNAFHKMGRKFFVGGNWKMNGTKAGIDSIIDFLSKGPLDPNAGVPVFYFTYLFTYRKEC